MKRILQVISFVIMFSMLAIIGHAQAGTWNSSQTNSTQGGAAQFSNLSVNGNNVSGAASQPSAAITASPVCATASTSCFQIYDDGLMVWNSAAYTSGSNAINCNACTFATSDVGKVLFTTNANDTGYTYQIQSQVQCNGTISSYVDAHDVTISNNCTATSGGSSLIIWGHDDSTNLATAWTAAVNSCSVLQLPGENAQGNGPAAMLVAQAEFNTAPGTLTKANCALGSEGNRTGVGLRGYGKNATYIIPTPSFNFATCTYGLSGAGCFGSINDGGFLDSFMIFGGGNSSPNGATASNVVIDVNYQSIVSPTSGNNALHDIGMMGWGADSNGIGFGLVLEGGTTQCAGVDVDGVGIVGVKVQGGGSGQTCTSLNAFDNYRANLEVTGTGTIFTSIGGTYCCVFVSSTSENVAVLGSAVFYSIGDAIGDGVGPSTVASNGLALGFLSSPVGVGTAYLSGTILAQPATATAAYIATAGSKLYASKSKFAGGSTSGYGIYNVGSFYDLGGNTLSGTTAAYTCASCTGVFGDRSIGGTLTTSAKFALSTGWGSTAAVSAVSGTQAALFTVTNSGTGQAASPTITYTFPTPYWQAPLWCSATQVGGTNSTLTFSAGTPSTTSVVFTASGTPTASSTEIVQVSCTSQQ